MDDEPNRRPKPNEDDIRAGARLRERRLELGMSQERLADAVGVTFQQIQKYERGVNRMSVSRLVDMARVLGVGTDTFFPPSPTFQTGPALPGMAEQQEGFDPAPARSPETEELLRAFARITDPNVRQRVLDLIRSLAPPAAP